LTLTILDTLARGKFTPMKKNENLNSFKCQKGVGLSSLESQVELTDHSKS